MAGDFLRLIPLGGLGEIGKNMMVLETAEDIIVIDSGLMFPYDDMLGVDLVIPDTTYLESRAEKIRGILITHGHEDHTGALPYVLRRINAPIYCTKLTRGLIEVKLKEHHLLDTVSVRTVVPGERVSLGRMSAEWFSVAHSIPDAAGIIVRTPAGVAVHTGDFKLDHTPVMGQVTDLPRLAAVGDEGVLVLMSDSTYAEVDGYTPSEQLVGESLNRIFAEADGRVIVATFASLISRVQLVADAAMRSRRKLFVTGRSMVDNVGMARELGYLDIPDDMLGKLEELKTIEPHRVAVVTTGSQGEPTSGLARMANREHKHVRIAEGDTVVLSASPIPGNELTVSRTVDNLFRQGANVLYNRVANVHVRGHASQEELKLILGLTRPKYFVPVHGEYRHLMLHARLAQEMGVAAENAFVLTDGDVLEMTRTAAAVVDKAPSSEVYVDGLGIGDVDHVVLRDRRHLSTDGVVAVIIAIDRTTGQVVGRPDIVARGFMESEELLDRTRVKVASALDGPDALAEVSVINTRVKEVIAKFLYDETRRRPMVLPVVVEV
jgi:ribonuclease J